MQVDPAAVAFGQQVLGGHPMHLLLAAMDEAYSRVSQPSLV